MKAGLGLWSRGWRRRESGAVSPLFALMLVPLIGGMGMATEVSNWYLTHRAMQNAADSAAIAAATNGTGTEANKCTGSDFCYEAKAAAGRFGYVDGAGNATITASYLNAPAGCPGSVPSCYQVTIQKKTCRSHPASGRGITRAHQGLSWPCRSPDPRRFLATAIARATVTADLCMMAMGATGNKGYALNGEPRSKGQSARMRSLVERRPDL